ncbi:thiamine pyrophosphate-binding protein [Shimia biformata]|uniref:thiamine pyrophosphate-binding protein n=1 Tax=Shimia biformata TaxID=1294299 RepID=UPI001951402C|nr:thiamine pyrophosphate-binding protein [Shimia biformata]
MTDRPIRHGGRILADQLAILGARRVFCVPGESYLGLLDGLYDHRDKIEVITCRHEGGAANMADAFGKMTGEPGIVAVTRGPGATNASNGVHTAFQDSTPMIVLIGQVGTDMMDREAFQEMDYRRMFGEMAKWVAQIDDPARIPEYMSRAWTLCQTGRPGPVVLALPEGTLSGEAAVADLRPVTPPRAAPLPGDMARLRDMLKGAKRPMMVAGGPGWNAECQRLAGEVALKHGLVLATAFRFQDYVDNDHPHYAGVIGIAPNPRLRRAIAEETDLLLAVGPRFGEMTTQGYTLIDIPNPQMPMVHVHPGADELGHVYAADLLVQSHPQEFLEALLALDATGDRDTDWRAELAASFIAFQKVTKVPGDVNMGEVIRHLDAVLPKDAVLTNGAGNYAVWLHRFIRHRRWRTQLAPTSGSMGYGVPAAIAAKLENRDRVAVALAGDGCFLMTAQELATARHHDAAPICLVVNNGMYGTIRMHQERNHPGRVISTGLTNPDFVAYAAAFGMPGEVVTRTDDFPAAMRRAMESDAGYLIELQVDPEALTPVQTLSEARAQGEAG